jgi:hypothetical protein
MKQECKHCQMEFDALDGRNKYCSDECRRAGAYERNREWEKANPEKARKRKREWNKRNKEKINAYRRRKNKKSVDV